MRRDSLQHANGDGPEEVVPTTFDENALRVLIEMDVSTLYTYLLSEFTVVDV